MKIQRKMIKLNSNFRKILLVFFANIIIIFLAYKILFQRFKITGESIECTLDAPIPFNYTCKLNKNNNDMDSWSFEGNIPDGIEIPDMMATITTYHYFNETSYEAVYLENTTVNVCKYSGGTLVSLLIATYLPGLPDKSNLNRPCPFKGKIFVDNFQLTPAVHLPRALSGKWMIDTMIYLDGFKEFTFRIRVILHAKPIESTFF